MYMMFPPLFCALQSLLLSFPRHLKEVPRNLPWQKSFDTAGLVGLVVGIGAYGGISSLLALDVSRPSEVGWTELVCCCLSYSAEDVATMSGSWCFVWAFGPEFRFQIFWDMFSSVDLGSTLFIAKDIVPLLSSNFCFFNWRLVTYSLNYLLVNVSQGGFDGSLTLSVGFSLICRWN